MSFKSLEDKPFAYTGITTVKGDKSMSLNGVPMIGNKLYNLKDGDIIQPVTTKKED